MNNYRLIDKKYIKEIDAEVSVYEHQKSGARVVKINADDANKTFSIAFKTEPVDDSGIPHILEHSVLNGSKHYPIKSPFDQLLKGSLATFLNAMTGNDVTLFPVASMNEKDYFNLTDIYLDAVFNPLMLTDKKILMQEGCRITLADKDSECEYNGVVYNEMKGYYSDPLRELEYVLLQNLFPDNGYGLSSGGRPSQISELTYEHFIEYYKSHYHPENSYIYFYGNASQEKEFALLDKYLQNYSKTGNSYDIKPQKPFDNPKFVSLPYSASEEQTAENDTYLSLSFVSAPNTDIKLNMALDVLGDVLVNMETGAVRSALEKAQIGNDIEFWLDGYQQNVFTFLAMNCNKADAETFKTVILDTLQHIADNGVDEDALKASVNRLEFSFREGNDAQPGLRYFSQMLTPWMNTDNYFLGLEWEKPLNEFKQIISEGYLSDVIRDIFINNNHCLLLDFYPLAGREQQIELDTAQKLKDFKKSLSDNQINDLIKFSKDFEESLNRRETPEELNCIPVLQKSDLNEQPEFIKVDKESVSDVKILKYQTFTNNIVYSNLYFNLSVLPFDLLPYAGLLIEFWGKTDTENYKYGKLDTELKTYTGSYGTDTAALSALQEDHRQPLPFLVTGAKALSEQTSKMLDLVGEIIFKSKFDNKDRIHDLLQRISTQIDSSLNSNPFSSVRTRSDAAYDQSIFICEYVSGLNYCRFVKNLFENFDSMYDDLIIKLKQTVDLLLVKDNLILTVICQEKDYKNFVDQAAKLIAMFPDKKSVFHNYEQKPQPVSEAFTGQSKVQYVIAEYDYLKSGFKPSGKLQVLNKILSTDYLQNEVRVKGGAYGGFSKITTDGLMAMMSYRDPNLESTVNTFKNADEYVKNLKIDDAEMLKYIIGTISIKDQPLSVSQKGNVGFCRVLAGITDEKIKATREEILNTTLADINNYAPLLTDFANKSSLCVFGGEDKISKAEDLFNHIEKLIQ